MIFNEFEKVKIKQTGMIGTIVDKSTNNGVTRYIVESDTKGPAEGGYGNTWPLFDCTAEDIEGVRTDVTKIMTEEAVAV